MKKIENSFVVTGFVAKDAEIRQFTNTSVARFPLAISRQEKNGVKHSRIVMVTTKFYPAVEKEETPAEPEKKPGKGKK